MRIRKIRISRFRSLKDIELDGLNNLVVIIGSNNSGKTNLLEAMTISFSEFSTEFERNLGGISDYSWFDRDHNKSVIFDITIELDSNEISSMIPEDIIDTLDFDETTQLRYVQEITGTPSSAILSLKNLQIGQYEIVPLSKDDSIKITADQVGQIIQKLTERLHNTFSYFPASRDVSVGYTGLQPRSSIVKNEELIEIRNLGQSSGRDEIKRWNKVEKLIKDISPKVDDIRICGSDLSIREKGHELPMPANWNGGGYQELIAMANRLNKGQGCILGIDEPEQHLHSGLARRLFDKLKDYSETQQVLISTHSPIFVDRAQLENIWIARKEKIQTLFSRLKDNEGLRNIQMELGIRPSDIFQSNSIVFVEGPTERVLFPILAKKMNIDFNRNDVVFFPTYGKSSGKYHLSVWVETTKSANIPFFMILDNNALSEARELIKKGFVKNNENLFLLKKGDIEDYYPRGRLINSLERLFNITISDDIRKELDKGNTVKLVEDIFISSGQEIPKRWKVDIARAIAEEIETTEIDDEIRRILERIGSKSGSIE